MSQAKEFSTLISPHLPQLYRLAYRFSKNHTDSEDLIQDFLIKIYPRTPELLNLDNAGAWLARVLYNLYIDNYRQQTRSALYLAIDNDQAEQLLEHSPLQSTQNLNQDLELERLQTAIDNLSEDHRALLVLHDIEGYSPDELTKILDIPIGTLKSRLHRAREHIRTLLNR